MSALKQTVARGLLALMAPLLFILLLEFSLRLFGVGYDPRFVIPHDVDGEPHWVENEKFGWRFFHPQIARTPEPISLPVEKAEDEFRILVLGGSAAQGDPMPEFSAARMLEVMCQKAMPDRPVKVVNCAMTAVNSHVVRVIAREVKVLEPDAVILYMGNNEVIGPYGPASVRFPWQRSYLWIRMHSELTGTRVGQVLQSLIQELAPLNFSEWRGMEMFLENRVAQDDPALKKAYAMFRENLEAIVDVYDNSGVPVLVNTVAVNLKDLAPFAEDLGGEASGVFIEGRREGSVEKLRRARDLDPFRFRADSMINDILRGSAHVGEASRLLDIERLFPADVGADYFDDHVHFSWNGNVMLAEEWLVECLSVAKVTPPEVWSRLDRNELLRKVLGYDVGQQSKLKEILLTRWGQPPFTGLSNWSEGMLRIHSMEVVKLDRSSEEVQGSMFPLDYYHMLHEVEAALRGEEFQTAEQLVGRMLMRWPLRRSVRLMVSKVASANGDFERAEGMLADSAHLFAHTEGGLYIQIANELLEAGEIDLAEEWFVRAERHTNILYDSLLGRGIIAEIRGDRRGAVNLFLRCLELRPDGVKVKNNLLALWSNGSEVELKRALKMGASITGEGSGQVEFRYNYGLALIKAGQFKKAKEQFEKALHLSPGFWPAARDLSLLYLQTENYEAVLEVTDFFSKVAFDDIELIKVRGVAYERLGDKDRSLHLLNRLRLLESHGNKKPAL